MVDGLFNSKGAYKIMSSDEEADEGFLTHPYSWESDSFKKIKESLDKTYLDICPARSKRLLQKRIRGSVKEQDIPKVSSEFSWIFQ